jgi:hypothetical protein
MQTPGRRRPGRGRTSMHQGEARAPHYRGREGAGRGGGEWRGGACHEGGQHHQPTTTTTTTTSGGQSHTQALPGTHTHEQGLTGRGKGSEGEGGQTPDTHPRAGTGNTHHRKTDDQRAMHCTASAAAAAKAKASKAKDARSDRSERSSLSSASNRQQTCGVHTCATATHVRPLKFDLHHSDKSLATTVNRVPSETVTQHKHLHTTQRVCAGGQLVPRPISLLRRSQALSVPVPLVRGGRPALRACPRCRTATLTPPNLALLTAPPPPPLQQPNVRLPGSAKRGRGDCPGLNSFTPLPSSSSPERAGPWQLQGPQPAPRACRATQRAALAPVARAPLSQPAGLGAPPVREASGDRYQK